MKTLLIVAHGSRRESSNDEVRNLVAKVSANLPVAVDGVAIAFLELTSPSIEAAINNCFNSGTEEIVVLPYFLSAGNHVVEDIPRETQEALAKWPDKRIKILPHIGANDAMSQLIAGMC